MSAAVGTVRNVTDDPDRVPSAGVPGRDHVDVDRPATDPSPATGEPSSGPSGLDDDETSGGGADAVPDTHG